MMTQDSNDSPKRTEEQAAEDRVSPPAVSPGLLAREIAASLEHAAYFEVLLLQKTGADDEKLAAAARCFNDSPGLGFLCDHFGPFAVELPELDLPGPCAAEFGELDDDLKYAMIGQQASAGHVILSRCTLPSRYSQSAATVAGSPPGPRPINTVNVVWKLPCDMSAEELALSLVCCLDEAAWNHQHPGTLHQCQFGSV